MSSINNFNNPYNYNTDNQSSSDVSSLDTQSSSLPAGMRYRDREYIPRPNSPSDPYPLSILEDHYNQIVVSLFRENAAPYFLPQNNTNSNK